MTKQTEILKPSSNYENPLGTEKIPTLIARYAIPSVISMIITALYNIVDQIFIGRGVGYLGNTATNITMPLVSFALAVSLLMGVGCSSYMNLCMGEGKHEKAAKAFCSAFIMTTLSAIIITALALIFLKPMLYLFGATDNSISYSMDYASVIALGLPFNAIAVVLNNAMRADGSPRYSMVSISIGAVINCILDPIFIFVFKWGVPGAAWATIIGQAISMVFSLSYLKRFKHIKLRREYFTLKNSPIKRILAQGTSNFITQFGNVLVQVVMNNSLKFWGAQSKYGSDICIAALGITMKVNMILVSVILGISIGMQPILGYNYGAKKYDRAWQTYTKSALYASIAAIMGWLVFMLAPNAVISLFGQEDALYNEFAVLCLRLFLGAVLLSGFQICSSSMFQAIGKPSKSVLLTMLRQLLVLIPLILLLPRFIGLLGILYSGLITDVVAFLFAVIFVTKERKIYMELVKKDDEIVLKA